MLKYKMLIQLYLHQEKTLLKKKQLLLPHALLRVEDGVSWITVINASQSPQYLDTRMIIGDVALPTASSLTLPMLPVQSLEHINPPDLKCRVCHQRHSSKKQLF